MNFLGQFMKNVGKLDNLVQQTEKKIAEYKVQIAELSQKLQSSVLYVKKLKEFVEVEMTKLIKKDIHLVGEINKLTSGQ